MFKNTLPIIIFNLLLCTRIVYSQWDFAVVTKTKIVFYDETWTEVTSSAHQFDAMSGIAVDEVKERIYFNDQEHNNGSIFSLKLPLGKGAPHIIENITRTPNERIAGLAYDPLDDTLYWTDKQYKKILYYPVNSPDGSEPKVLFDFSNTSSVPDGIAIDVCRRKLYWTNSSGSDPSIHKASLDGKDVETLNIKGLFFPRAIVVDQLTDRIYYVDDKMGVRFNIESANLDGTDRQILVQDSHKEPYSLTVTKNAIYWTDPAHSAIWTVPKFNTTEMTPVKVKSGFNDVRGIVSRVGFMTKLKTDPHCKAVIQKLRRNLTNSDNYTSKPGQSEKNHDLQCLSNGVYSQANDKCTCKSGFKGARCEVNECHNYCVHGSCEIVESHPMCTCKPGFIGERCQTSKCTNYCLNGGRCRIEEEQPSCDCPMEFIGRQCSVNATQECVPYCLLMRNDIEIDVPRHCYRICKNIHPEDLVIQDMKRPDELCRGTWNKSVIVVVCGALGGLVLIYVIIQALRRIYKPARPRIKKTFVVQKKVSQTPLTCRPIATEQCEITIENCCNMNICDTPCFDTNLLQQNMSKQSHKKEDKEILIHNMEDELY